MITAPMVHYGIKVNLPDGNSKELEEKQELVITMNKEGALYFNGEQVERTSLIATVQAKHAPHDDTPVYIRADEAITYGQVMTIVDELKSAGVRYVAMSTQATK